MFFWNFIFIHKGDLNVHRVSSSPYDTQAIVNKQQGLIKWPVGGFIEARFQCKTESHLSQPVKMGP